MALAASMAAAGCSGYSPKGQDEPCFGTAECQEGLICNVAFEPPRCTLPSTEPPPDASAVDAAPVIDAPPGAPDAAQPPDAATPDAAPPPPPDAAPPPPDAALPDAAA